MRLLSSPSSSAAAAPPQLLLLLTTRLVVAAAWPSRGLIEHRQSDSDSSCPALHIIGARQPGADPGLGSTEAVVNLLVDEFPDSTVEPLDFPALGDDDYARSVTAGIRALLNQTETFAERCPESRMVLLGYSQGAQIIDDAMCGGPDEPSLMTDVVPMPPDIGERIVAAIWLGNPRFIGGLPYNVGSADEGGFAARPRGFTCDTYADRIQSYCEEKDPFCSQGDSELAHNNYGAMYGGSALNFVKAQMASLNETDLSPVEGDGYGSPEEVSAAMGGRPDTELGAAVGLAAAVLLCSLA